ncbi:uncharacterized protein LOC108744108 [Agrilus planipennis]|uniref:Uncharacterized protein LOC108744108 n=1 Tax=Agrilus planipennis TaxID=224129 RepID=A0A1W4XS20_AGRPL|nr:uncharacterized protein LOC108744108 [Agrilus planipennis]
MKVVAIVLFVVKFGSCAKILAHFIMPSISHQFVYQKIWKELSLRGHEVTVITPNPLKDENPLANLTEIDVSFSYVLMKKALEKNAIDNITPDIGSVIKEIFIEFMPRLFDLQMKDPDVSRIYKNVNGEKYDLVIVEPLYPVVYGLAAKYDCPSVGVISLSGFKIVERSVGNPSHPALYPDVFLDYSNAETLWQRMHSTYSDMITYFR